MRWNFSGGIRAVCRMESSAMPRKNERVRGTLAFSHVERQTEAREYLEGSRHMLLANWRVRGPNCEEVVEIVESVSQETVSNRKGAERKPKGRTRSTK